MAIAYNPTPIDFSALTNIGQNIGGALGQHNLGNAMQGAINPDGTVNYDKMIGVLAGRKPLVAAQLAADRANNNSALDWMKFGLAKQEAESRAAARTKPSATDKKAAYEAQDSATGLETMLHNFREAEGYLNEGGEGQGIYEGYGAGLRADAGTKIPFGGSEWLGKQGVVDTAKAKRTQDYLSIMTPQAMQFMAEQLKGSTAYQELLAFTRIYADPSTPNSTKAGLLRRLIAATEATLATKRARATELGSSGGGGDMPSLTPGVEVDGYEYLGGDPNDQGSWRALQ